MTNLVKRVKTLTGDDEIAKLEELVEYGEQVLAKARESFGAKAAYAQVLAA